MLACISVGNTYCLIGIFLGKEDKIDTDYNIKNCLSKKFFATYDLYRNLDKLVQILANWPIKQCIICSVVPYLEQQIYQLIQTTYQCTPCLVKASILDQVGIKIQCQSSLGTDRVANLISARHIYNNSKYIIIIDVGTATTFCVLDNQSSTYIGGWICPGPRIQKQSLHLSAAQLQYSCIGMSCNLNLAQDTESQINHGIYAMHYHAIQGGCQQIKHQLLSTSNIESKNCIIVGTGGESKIFQKLFDYWQPNLTLIGLLIYNQMFSK